MPEPRDPALEAAVERFIAVGGPFYRLELGSAFRAGWESCLRALSAGTPEAQDALRGLVTAVNNLRLKHGPRSQQLLAVLQAADEFAALATPTEEGR